MSQDVRAFPELTPEQEEFVRQEARNRCQSDLHYLAKQVLGYTKITDHYHKEMAYDVDTPHYRFKLLLHARGHYKSTLATESGTIKKLLNDPNERILITNAKLDNSRKFLRTISHHFSVNPRFRWIWRDWWITKYATPFHRAEMGPKLDWVVRDTQDELILLRPYAGREASVTTGAVDSSMVSQHYSTIIADDLVNRDYVRTTDMVEKTILYFKDLMDLLDPDGELMLIGTNWSHYDLYRWILNEFGHTAYFRIPATLKASPVPADVLEASKKTPHADKEWMVSIHPATKDGTLDGEPVFPEEFTPKVLANLLKIKGPYEFGAQYLLNPTPREFQRFQDDWIHTLDVLPDPRQLTVCITVDPANSLDDQACHSAIAVYGYDDRNNMYLLAGRDEKMKVEELPEAVFEAIVYWQARCRMLLPVGFETISFQQLYRYNLERMMRERNVFFAINEIPHRSQSKDERILRLVPRIKNGFFVPRKLLVIPFGGRDPQYDLVLRLKMYLNQFPFSTYKDFLDATADQLEIVQATGLPSDAPPPPEQPKPDFVHPSILEDKANRKRSNQLVAVRNFGVVG